MTIESLHSQLDALDQAGLYEPADFRRRADVIDTITFDIIDRIDGLLSDPAQPYMLYTLRRKAEQLQQRLYAVDEEIFHALRLRIRAGFRGEPLRQLIEQLVGISATDQGRSSVGYDHLDRLITGILDSDTFPEPMLEPEPDMVLYQRTPAKIIFDLVWRMNPGSQDCFYDLGSGMGHVATLVHLLSNIPARGVEIEPAFCSYARERAALLGLTQVAFITADVRYIDYAEGTIFFMYTPCEGIMLWELLTQLRKHAQQGPIRLATYGACTAIVAQQDWLSAPDPPDPGSHRLAIFSSHMKNSSSPHTKE